MNDRLNVKDINNIYTVYSSPIIVNQETEKFISKLLSCENIEIREYKKD